MGICLTWIAAGCSVIPVPLTAEDLEQRVQQDLNQLTRYQDPVSRPITLYEAMARALRFNLEARVEGLKEMVAHRQLDLAHYDLLPKVVAEDTALNISGISVNDVDGNLSTVQLAVTQGTVTVTLSGGATISSGANGTSTLTLSGTQADINATLASLNYQGNLNYNGADTLTVTSTVTADNDAPVNTVPGAQVVAEDTALNISGISVNDVDGNLSTVQLAVTQGTVTVTLSGSATISSGANGTSTLTLSGTQADINATLASLSYQGNLNYNGADTLTVTSTDGNYATDVDTVAITVTETNDAPVITSHGGGATANLSLAENIAGVTTMTATDPNGDSLTYSIVGGADAARFTVDSLTGTLRFVGAPDFENPTDAGGNNVYDVQVQVSDGRGVRICRHSLSP